MLSRLPLDLSSRPGQIMSIPTWFNFFFFLENPLGCLDISLMYFFNNLTYNIVRVNDLINNIKKSLPHMSIICTSHY
jgi:hypothetical protein